MVTPAERITLAAKAAISEQYLYQALTGRRDLREGLAVHVEKVSGGAVKRWQLRLDWFKAWPELVGSPGVPSLASAQRRLKRRDEERREKALLRAVVEA